MNFPVFLLLCFHSRRRQHGTCSQWLVRSGVSAHTKTWGFAQNQNTHDNTTHHPAPTSHHPPLTTHHGTNMHTYIHNYIHNYIPPTTLISILHRSCGRERGPQDSGLFSFATNAFMTSKPWAKKIVACTGLRRPPPNYCNAIIFPSAFSTSMTYLI